MLLAKMLHGELLPSHITGGLAVVMRSQVGLGELGRLWPRRSDPLMIGVKEEARTSYSILTAAMESKRRNQCSRIIRNGLLLVRINADGRTVVLAMDIYDVSANLKSSKEACNHAQGL